MEQLAARDLDGRQYTTLADVTPALRTLCQVPLERLDAATRHSIEFYINAELLNVIRGSLYRCEIDAARSLCRLSPAPTAALRALRILLALPRPLIAAMAARYRTVRARQRTLNHRAVQDSGHTASKHQA
jgi:hypothetical protein